MTASGGPVAIVAGSGQLPLLLADSLRRDGRDHRVLAFRGFAERALRGRADAVVDLLDVRRALACLEGWSPSAVVLAGGVHRPAPAAFLGALSAYRNRKEIAEVIGRGDDQLLRAGLRFLEERGFRVLGIHDVAPELLARPGRHSAAAPGAEQARAVEIGLKVLADLSPYDMGQAAVVSGERVIALEGPEGTDRMLARVRGFNRFWSMTRVKPGGVLVKTVKHGQDLRVDLPAIGPRTVTEAHGAGLSGIAVGSGGTLILDFERTVAAADRLGLFLIGVAP
ncbi:MAG TPA: UDP-2,3-diacylglucosamine diphosphatase LpxI [Beijerinckiaceae bacterium]|nr:UDP-2,3-diacylglucosamine diphosphatase LpxI [Beijerinckiaceae bacterium]